MGREVAHELGVVAAGVGQTLDAEERLLRIARGQRLPRGEHLFGIRHTKDVEHVVELDRLAAVGDELLERPERVSEGAGGRPREHPDGRVRDLDLLLRGHPP